MTTRIVHTWVSYAAGLIALFNASGAAAQSSLCGMTLAADTTLTADMNCPGIGIVLNGAGSNNVMLDCAGHSIAAAGSIGISVSDVSGVTIKNCNITAASHGLRMERGVTNSVVSDNTISTTGDRRRGMEIRESVSNNQISGNNVHATGQNANAIRIRSGSNNNVVTGNTFEAELASAVNIQSASDNQVVENTLISPQSFVHQRKFSLQNGGMGVGSAGNIYAVENNWGSSHPTLGIGTATAFFQVDKTTGIAHSVMPLLVGGVDAGGGADALDVLPNGRILVLAGADIDPSLFEIDSNTGEVTDIGLNPPTVLNGLEATSNTSLLATTNAGQLMRIDLMMAPTPADVTLLGQAGNGWTGIAIDPTDGKAYAMSRQRGEASNTQHLYEINPANGAIVSEIGDTGLTFISDIDFAPDGTLYGNDGELRTINTSDGTVTSVTGVGFGPDPLEPFAANTRMENNVFQAADGSIQFTGSITLPTEEQTSISSERVKITSNVAKVDSTALPFLDAPAKIKLTGLSGSQRALLVDENDDGTFDTCASTRCTLVSFSGGTLEFDVTGFTTYSSEESSSGGGGSSGGFSVSMWLLLLLLLGVSIRGLRFLNR